ncbi:DNA replication complex GINS protein SLD5 [Palaemon carinicauda]|uniref:DNA replication complex GINS protein SLD5 n=1 Tax=Palaemon carinicauda TaxID=392227 RepID=UPI0035B60EC4
MDDSGDIIEGSDEEGEAMTAAEVLQKLEEAWITEKMSPTLERHQSEYVECMLDQINQMTENLKRCKKHDFRVAIHKMEIDRIRYMISSYLRIRIEKIEKFAHYLLEKEKTTDEESSLLSASELQYAKEYAANLESHFQSVVLQHVPENLRNFDPGKMAVKPNLDSFVFLKVKEETPAVVIEDDSGEGRDEEVDLEKDSQHLMRYKPVSHLLHSGAIHLI